MAAHSFNRMGGATGGGGGREGGDPDPAKKQPHADDDRREEIPVNSERGTARLWNLVADFSPCHVGSFADIPGASVSPFILD